MSAVCPVCGYNQGEERILVAHLVGVHGGIPHTQGEELFVCVTHPGLQPMNRLEFVKHTQEASSDVKPGMPKPRKCEPVNVSQGGVVTIPLKDWKNLAPSRARQEMPLAFRWGFSIAMSGAVLMIITGVRFIPVVGEVFPLSGWVQLLAGFAVLAGSAIFYSNPSRHLQGSAIALISSAVGWVAVLLIVARLLTSTAYVAPVLMAFLILGPLFATIGSSWNLLHKGPTPKT